MAVLMSVTGAGGGPNGGTRRCDGTCHTAKNEVCVCVCGGRYHGKGTPQAFQAHQQDALDGVWGDEIKRVTQLYQAEKQRRLAEITATVHPLIYQQPIERPEPLTFTFV